jgi:hypothetical protein
MIFIIIDHYEITAMTPDINVMEWSLPLPIVLGAVLDFVQMGLPSILPKVRGQGLNHSIVHCELSVELQQVYAIIFSEVYTTIIPRKG